MQLKIRYTDPESKETKETTVDHDGAATVEGAAVIVKRDLEAALGWQNVEVLGEVSEARKTAATSEKRRP